MLAWILELLLGTWLVLLVRRKTPEWLQQLEREPLTTPQLPATDVPDVLQGGIIGGGVFLLALIVISAVNGPLSTIIGFAMLCAFPVLGALLQQRITGRQMLASGHPWRILVEELAQKAGVGPVQVVLVQTTNPHVTTRGQTIFLPTCAVRRFSTEEQQFLIALALWELRGGQSQSDLGDQFALSLTRNLTAAQKALLGIHLRQDVGNYLPRDFTDRRIERLTSWWQRQHPLTTASVITVAPATQVQQMSRP